MARSFGDMDLRLRAGSSGPWQSFSTALARQPVKALTAAKGELAVADLGPTLPADIPLAITRIWAVENGKLALRFVLKNKTNHPVEIGSLGIPMIFNSILSGLPRLDLHRRDSLRIFHVHVGRQHGRTLEQDPPWRHTCARPPDAKAAPGALDDSLRELVRLYVFGALRFERGE